MPASAKASPAARKRATAAPSPSIGPRYRVRMLKLHAHVFDVELELERPDPAGQELWLPVWVPGSYLVREFARHVLDMRAFCGRRELGLRKTAKNRWRIEACEGPLRVQLSVYAHDASVRAAWLDPSRGFFNASSLLPAAAGFEHVEHQLSLEPPPELRWSVATTLPARRVGERGFGVVALICGGFGLLGVPVAFMLI